MHIHRISGSIERPFLLDLLSSTISRGGKIQHNTTQRMDFEMTMLTQKMSKYLEWKRGPTNTIQILLSYFVGHHQHSCSMCLWNLLDFDFWEHAGCCCCCRVSLNDSLFLPFRITLLMGQECYHVYGPSRDIPINKHITTFHTIIIINNIYLLLFLLRLLSSFHMPKTGEEFIRTCGKIQFRYLTSSDHRHLFSLSITFQAFLSLLLFHSNLSLSLSNTTISSWAWDAPHSMY